MLQVPRLTVGTILIPGDYRLAYILIEYMPRQAVWRRLWGSTWGADRWQPLAISLTSRSTADASSSARPLPC